MMFIRQGATIKVVIGPAVAVSDGFTPVTTLSLASADEAEVILHDNGTVVDISGYTFAAITTADGYYHLTLQTGISNTVGHVTVVINDDSLILPIRADFMVVEEAVYDQLFASSAPGAATVAELLKVPKSDSNVTWNATAAAQIQSECNDALVAQKLDHLVAVADADDVVDDSIIAKMVSKSATADWSGFVNTTDSLEALRDRGDAAWITATGFSTHSAADVWSVATRVLTAATNITAAIADQVWEEAIADHSGTAGSTAEALNAAGSAGDPWTTSLPGSYTGSQAGKMLSDILVDTGTTLQAELDGIQADTEDIQTRIPAALTADGNIKADTLRVGGTLQTARDIGASVLLSSGTGTGQLDFTSGIVKSDMRKTGGQLVDTVSPVDGNGYPYVNVLAFGNTASTIVDDIRAFQYIVTGGTASATSSTVVGPNGFSTVDDFYKNCLIYIGSGTGIGQVRLCTGYTGSSRTFAVSPNWETTPAAADKIYVLPAGLSGGTYGNTVQTGDAYAVVSNGTYGNSALNTDIDSIVTLLSSTGIALTATERNAVADALLDRANGIETSVTPRQALRAIASLLCGIISGGGTGTEVFKAIAAASGGTTRVTVTVDEDGNRSAVTLNL